MQIREPAPNGTYAPFGSAAFALRGEALGPELARLREDVREMVRDPRAVVDVGAAGDGLAGELERLDRPARADPRRRVHPQRLVLDHLEQLELSAHQHRGVRALTAEHAVLLVAQRGRDVRVARELVEHEPDRRGRRVVPGEQQRHHLVADLSIVQALAFLVGRVDQQAEHVLAALAAAPPPRDLVEDHAVERAARLLHLRERGARPAQHLKQVVARPEPEPLLEAPGDVDPRAGGVGIEPEQRAHRDPERQPTGPVVDVDPRAVAPTIERAVDLGLHRRERRRDRLVVEGGQHDPARAAMELTVDRQQPVAEQRRQVAHVALAPAEVAGVRDGHVVVGLGADHEHAVAVEDPHREHRPVALVAVEQDGRG